MPRELQQPLAPLADGLDKSSAPANLPSTLPRPLSSSLLPSDLTAKDYAQAFLHEFGADVGKAVLWRDPAGLVTPISEDLFKSRGGHWKADKRGRGKFMLRLAEALKDPDEIWLSWAQLADGAVRLVRTYLRYGDGDRAITALRWSQAGWSAATSFTAETDRYFENLRRGALLWRRKD